MRVLLVILVGCEIYGIKELEASESKKSFVDSNQESHQEERPDSFVYIYIYIKSPRRKTCFHSLDTISKILRLRLSIFRRFYFFLGLIISTNVDSNWLAL